MTTSAPRPKGFAPKIFIWRLLKNLFYGIALVVLSLLSGMMGYHYFEGMTWLDSYVNAAMILSGMGPLQPMQTAAGKIFAGTYALFSGVIFLVIVAVMFAPVVHYFLHKFHMKEDK